MSPERCNWGHRVVVLGLGVYWWTDGGWSASRGFHRGSFSRAQNHSQHQPMETTVRRGCLVRRADGIRYLGRVRRVRQRRSPCHFNVYHAGGVWTPYTHCTV